MYINTIITINKSNINNDPDDAIDDDDDDQDEKEVRYDLCILNGDIFDVKCILFALNKINPKIQFTLDMEYHFRNNNLNGKYLEILDCKFILEKINLIDNNGNIYGFDWNVAVCIHSKDTDTHCTLDNDSDHVKHQLYGIVISAAIRLRSICDDQFIDEQCKLYKAYLIARGSDPIYVNTTFNYYMKLTKKQALGIWNNPNYDKKYRKYIKNKNIDKKLNLNEKINDKTFWLVLPWDYRMHKVNVYNILSMVWNKWIKPYSKLALLFPLEKCKLSWKTSNNLDSILSPNNFKINWDTQSTTINNINVNMENDFRVDGKKINIDNLDNWKGFIKCKDLKDMNIANGHGNCNCRKGKFKDIFENKKWWKSSQTGESIKLDRSSCFSQDVVYIIWCAVCNKPSFGKCGRGINEDRRFCNRTSEHTRDILKLYDMLCNKGIYDKNGKLIDNLGILTLYLKTIKKDVTGEVLHFLGLDGTQCYLQNNGNPIKSYRTAVIRKYNGDRLYCEAEICKMEKYFQAQFCSYIDGMNGTKDLNNIDIFSRDMILKVKELQKEYLDNIFYLNDSNLDDSILNNSIMYSSTNFTSNFSSLLDSSNIDNNNNNIITDNNDSLDTLQLLHNLTQNIVDMDWHSDIDGVLNILDEDEHKYIDEDQVIDDEEVLVDLHINSQTLQ